MSKVNFLKTFETIIQLFKIKFPFYRLRIWLELEEKEKESFKIVKELPQNYSQLSQLSVAETSTIGQREGLYNVKAWVWECRAEESIYKGCPTCKTKV